MLIFLLFISVQSRSQQLITFTNGTALNAVIIYHTKDSIRYYRVEDPAVIFGESMDHILKIETFSPEKESKPQDKTGTMPIDKEYWKYKRNCTTGGILMGTGVVLGFAGLAGWSGTHKADNADQFLGATFSVMGMVIGTGLFVAGGIILAVNASNLTVYKNEHGLSLDLKCTPQVQGISLAYRF